MLNQPNLYGLVLLGIGLYLIQKLFFGQRSQLPLPPGPKGLPIIGNLKDMPAKGQLEWKHWIKHKDIYGPISSVTILGKTIIFVNDWDITQDLLVKRSAKYSMRPSSPMMNLSVHGPDPKIILMRSHCIECFFF